MKKKKLTLLDPLRDGPGVQKGEDTTPNLKFFFKQWKRKFWKLISINLLMLIQILPFVVIFLLQMAGPKEPSMDHPMYAPLMGAHFIHPSAEGATLLSSVASLNLTLPTANTPVNYVFFGLLLFHVITYGWQKVGSTYLMRNLVRGDGVFILSDFFYAIKRNWKQGFVLGLLDCIFCGVLYLDIQYFAVLPPTAFNNFMYFAIIALIIIYAAMRFYTYLMLVTFNIKISKIFKNALIFTVLGIKRNLMAALGIFLLAAVMVALAIGLMQISTSLLGVAIIIPFLCFLAFAAFMYTYAAYPVIKRYMIDPVPAKAPAATPVSSSDDNEDTANEA